jgi:hypothetical protein
MGSTASSVTSDRTVCEVHALATMSSSSAPASPLAEPPTSRIAWCSAAYAGWVNTSSGSES